MWFFKDREEAGKVLAHEIQEYANDKNVLVLALPRGGVPVAYEVATTLNAPLDLFLVRKLGVPGQTELAFGAIASGDIRVLNKDIVYYLGITDDIINAVSEREKEELKRRIAEYRGNKPFPEIKNKTIILIDDGLATGASMKAAVEALNQLNPGKVIIAVPIASPDTCAEFEKYVEKVVCVVQPYPFHGVGYWYENFSQTSDSEVKYLLKKAEEQHELNH